MDSASKYDLNKIESVVKALSFMSMSARIVLNHMSAGKKSVTFMEGLLVGLLSNYEKFERVDTTQLDKLLVQKSKEYPALPSFINVQRYAVSSENIVKTRLREAKELFSSIS